MQLKMISRLCRLASRCGKIFSVFLPLPALSSKSIPSLFGLLQVFFRCLVPSRNRHGFGLPATCPFKILDPRACESLCAIENRHVGRGASNDFCPAHTGPIRWRDRVARSSPTICRVYQGQFVGYNLQGFDKRFSDNAHPCWVLHVSMVLYTTSSHV